MQKCIVGKKIGMTQIFDEKGKVVPGYRRRSRPLRCCPEENRRKRRLRGRSGRLWRHFAENKCQQTH